MDEGLAGLAAGYRFTGAVGRAGPGGCRTPACPCFVADMKGDVSGMAEPGQASDKLAARVEQLKAAWEPHGSPGIDPDLGTTPRAGDAHGTHDPKAPPGGRTNSAAAPYSRLE
jgi:hypothetical protein